MNFEDTKVGKTYLVKFDEKIEVEVYRSKQSQTFINANDCKTVYSKERCRIIKEVK